ncbi:MAG TPA: 4'-phosphopantetheinyl transferase superfamily protein, partial [Burkholderiaceae bacterium]|nr:4'-phosphopantetheinyl transferase superfamily protein [Burkholderiaceae bacterium]
MTGSDYAVLPIGQSTYEVADGDVHVWQLDVRKQFERLAELEQLLSENEQAAAAKYAFANVRERYVTVRGMLRTILAGYLATRPERIDFVYGAYGKPDIGGDHAGPGITFNVSHSGDLALVAVAKGRQVGVDLEQARPRPSMDRLAERLFSPLDLIAWRSLPTEQQVTEFYRSWTWKEAYLKAIGRGLSGELDGFTLHLIHGRQMYLPA